MSISESRELRAIHTNMGSYDRCAICNKFPKPKIKYCSIECKAYAAVSRCTKKFPRIRADLPVLERPNYIANINRLTKFMDNHGYVLVRFNNLFHICYKSSGKVVWMNIPAIYTEEGWLLLFDQIHKFRRNQIANKKRNEAKLRDSKRSNPFRRFSFS